MLDDSTHPGAAGQARSNALTSPLESHWSRILYCDFLGARARGDTPDLPALADDDSRSPASDFRHRLAHRKKENFMATNDFDHGTHRAGSPISAVLVLLGICIAAYFTVAAVAYVLASRDADAAVASARSKASATAPAASTSTAGGSEAPAPDLPRPGNATGRQLMRM